MAFKMRKPNPKGLSPLKQDESLPEKYFETPADTTKGKMSDRKIVDRAKERSKTEAEKAKDEAAPTKSFLGLGKDNRETRARNKKIRQENKESRKEWREEKKGIKKEHKTAKKEYRKEKKEYKKGLKEAQTSGGGSGKHLSKAESDYFRKHKEDYSDEYKGGAHGTGKVSLANPDSKKGRKRRDVVRKDFKRDYDMEHKPVKPTKGIMPSKPTKKKREKLDTSVKSSIFGRKKKDDV